MVKILFKYKSLNYKYKYFGNILIRKENNGDLYPYEVLYKYLCSLESKKNYKAESEENSDIIWQCWLQGKEKMPEIIKACTESVIKQNPDKQVILITYDNLNEYINLPNYVIEKHRQSIIPYAHFSDIIRLALLKQYGGVWIDSTIYLTGAIPREAFTSQFFSYKGYCAEDMKKIKDWEQYKIYCCMNSPVFTTSTWFLASRKNNIVVSLWLDILLEYWKYENKLIDYFIMDYAFDLLLLHNSDCRKIFDAIPTYSTNFAGILYKALYEEYDAELYNNIKTLSPLHKLTYKNIPQVMPINSFYNIICKNN